MPTPRRFLLALTIIAEILLIGCDSNRLNTAPMPVKFTKAATIADQAPDLTSNLPSSTTLAAATTLGGPIAGLDAGSLARFTAGQAEFQDVETVDDGLGPVFNEASCGACHNAPLGGTTGRAETRFGKMIGGQFDPLTSLGGSLLQDHAIGLVSTEHGSYTFVPEVVPPRASVTATRITTPLFGLGLVDAVPDAALLQLAQLEARYSPSSAGTAHMVTEIRTGAMRVGRFGWKAQVPTLHQFSGDAYLNEMGVTNPEFPNENDPQGNHAALAYNPAPQMNDTGDGVQKFSDFMTLLGPPPRGPRTTATDAGGFVFRNIGCANCHTPTLTAGDSPVPAIAHKSFQPYSDFLLHDMGSLGDGIVQGQATGKQMRTAPLWGLSSRPTYLHDGRAKTPEAAILAHDGQASDARARYTRLDASSRTALLAFLKSL